MSIPHRPFALLAILGIGCATAGTPGGGGVTSREGAIIISGVALEDGPGTVLQAIRGKIPSMRIQRPSGQCPTIVLRNFVTFQSAVNPHVYVDRTRISDTCILDTIRTEDVESVEVYPMGVTSRPGYSPHAHGLILVFMRTG